MQVEVSKHTEGAKEKTLRPNGLPESLIRYDGTYSFIFICSIVMFLSPTYKSKKTPNSFDKNKTPNSQIHHFFFQSNTKSLFLLIKPFQTYN